MINLKIAALFMALVLFLGCLGGAAQTESRTIRVVTTIFPLYDWVREIACDRLDQMEITMLLDTGADLHNYQPTAPDILKVAQADLFIYVGGESDDWAPQVLSTAKNDQRLEINLMEALGEDVKEEEIVEGMEEEDHDEGDEEEHEGDEHIWLSLKNAGKLVQAIAQALGKIDPDYQTRYQANANAYIVRLQDLDQQYRRAVDEAKCKTILFGDRFPFRYLAEDYGLTYYAAFSGCSAESEASFQTIAFLAGKVDELGLTAVLTIENPKTELAQTIVQSTKDKNQRILSMNSLQSFKGEDLESGVNYLSVMAENLEVLKEALN